VLLSTTLEDLGEEVVCKSCATVAGENWSRTPKFWLRLPLSTCPKMVGERFILVMGEVFTSGCWFKCPLRSRDLSKFEPSGSAGWEDWRIIQP
jgi:hypothetical protein